MGGKSWHHDSWTKQSRIENRAKPRGEHGVKMDHTRAGWLAKPRGRTQAKEKQESALSRPKSQKGRKTQGKYIIALNTNEEVVTKGGKFRTFTKTIKNRQFPRRGPLTADKCRRKNR